MFESAPSSGPAAPQAPASAAANVTALLADVQALRQQAVATQTSLRELQGQDTASPWADRLFAVDGTLTATALALGLGLCATWWYLWQRPQRRRSLQAVAPQPAVSRDSAIEPPPRTPVQPTATTKVERIAPAPAASQPVAELAQAASPVPRPTEMPAPPVHTTTQPMAPALHKPASDWSPDSELTPLDHVVELSPESHPSIFARLDPTMAFDPAAAADEVQRVRQSLARKREIRSQGLHLDNEDEPEAFLPADSQQATQALMAEPNPEEDTARGELDFSFPDEIDVSPDPWAPAVPMQDPVAPEPLPMTDLSLDAISPDAKPDLAITLALALESEALELWDEARELANEVLEAGDTDQIIEAQTLINRLDAREVQIQYETELLPPDPNLQAPGS